MRCRVVMALGLIALVCSTSLHGQAQPKADTATGPRATPEEIEIVAKKLCKGEPIVGTRIPIPRKCDTPAQLKKYQAEARELIENYRRRPCGLGMESGEGKAMPC